jgi:hypothetical protein
VLTTCEGYVTLLDYYQICSLVQEPHLVRAFHLFLPVHGYFSSYHLIMLLSMKWQCQVCYVRLFYAHTYRVQDTMSRGFRKSSVTRWLFPLGH